MELHALKHSLLAVCTFTLAWKQLQGLDISHKRAVNVRHCPGTMSLALTKLSNNCILLAGQTALTSLGSSLAKYNPPHTQRNSPIR